MHTNLFLDSAETLIPLLLHPYGNLVKRTTRKCNNDMVFFVFQVVYDDLEIGKVIGKGSAGVVLAAVHKPSGLRLALKVCVF